jgi:hypothetical protein
VEEVWLKIPLLLWLGYYVSGLFATSSHPIEAKQSHLCEGQSQATLRSKSNFDPSDEED